MTVAELIVQLKTYPQDKLIAIEDADTSWHGDKIGFREYENALYMFIDYPEMDSHFISGKFIKESHHD